MRTRRVRGSLLLPLVLIGGGVLLLLSNLELVGFNAWETVARLWPVLLIAVGFDVIVGRFTLGTAIGVVISACAILATGLTTLYLFGPSEWITEAQTLTYPMSSAMSAEITLSCERCTISIASRADPANLLEGTIALRSDERLAQSVLRRHETTVYALRSERWFRIPLAARRGHERWELNLNPTVTVMLSVETSAMTQLDLRDLLVTRVYVVTGDAPSTIVLPEHSTLDVYISGADVTLYVPETVGVRIDRENLTSADVPATYLRADAAILSPTYEVADTTADVFLRPGTGRVLVESLREGGFPVE
jgi:hypothetical protein